MSYYFRKGNTYFQAAEKAVDLTDTLPTGTYTVKKDPNSGTLYFEIVDDLTIPAKRYGTLDKDAKRIINTFIDRPASTGVLLSGEKGSGKTLLAKTLSVFLMEQNIVTIIINTALSGEDFNCFIQELKQPALILFDEFEKVYDREEQQEVLTLLDGVYPTKKLFVLTCNDKYRVDEHMKNRPGRLFYSMEFSGLEKDFIREYAEENLNDTAKLDGIITISALFPKFNFDMLKALVEEMNRYNESAQEAVRMLNTKPDTGHAARYKVSVNSADERVPDSWFVKSWAGNPLGTVAIVAEGPGEEDYYEFFFTNSDLKRIDGESGKFLFKDENGTELTLERVKDEAFDWVKFV